MTEVSLESATFSPRFTYLDILRVLASLAVVALHVSTHLIVLPAVSVDSWMVANVINSFSRWAVPVFVMISGALLLNEARYPSLKHFYISRMKKILIPLILWHMVYFGWWHLIDGTPLTWEVVIQTLIFDQPFGHLYFLVLIAQLYILAPLWWYVQRWLTPTGEITTVISLFLVTLLWPTNRFVGLMWVPYVSYFVAGHYLHRWKSKDWRWLLPLWLTVSIVIAGGTYVLTHLLHVTKNLMLYDYQSLAVILQSALLFCLVKNWVQDRQLPEVVTRSLSHFASLTLGIYLLHPLVLYGLFYFFDWQQWLAHPLGLIVFAVWWVWTVSLLVSWQLKKTFLLNTLV